MAARRTTETDLRPVSGEEKGTTCKGAPPLLVRPTGLVTWAALRGGLGVLLAWRLQDSDRLAPIRCRWRCGSEDPHASLRPTGPATWAALRAAREFARVDAANSDKFSPVRRKAEAGSAYPLLLYARQDLNL